MPAALHQHEQQSNSAALPLRGAGYPHGQGAEEGSSKDMPGLLPCTGSISSSVILLHRPAARSLTAGLQPVGLRAATGKGALQQPPQHLLLISTGLTCCFWCARAGRLDPHRQPATARSLARAHSLQLWGAESAGEPALPAGQCSASAPASSDMHMAASQNWRLLLVNVYVADAHSAKIASTCSDIPT